MNYLASVQRGIDYIEQHLNADIDCADVARHAGISSWHFQRIFKALTRETLKGYIRSRRFAHALDALSGSKMRILEIAMDSGFRSQESFTRAFQKAFGTSPAAYRRRPGGVSFPHKIRFNSDYLQHLAGGVSLEPDLVHCDRLRITGLRTRMFGAESEKNNMGRKLPKLWADFLPRIGDVPHRIPNGVGYGVLQQACSGSGELTYWAGVPVTQSPARCDGFNSIELPPAHYARFEHRGPVTGLDQTVNYIYSSWLIRSGMRHTYGCDLEFYDERYIPDDARSKMYYLIPVADGRHQG